MSDTLRKDANAEQVILRVLPWEGGIAQVPGESWITYWGQTPTWLRDWELDRPDSVEDAIDNYILWLHKVRLIDLCTPADHLAFSVVDWAIHHGHVNAIRLLQRIAGTRPDGVYGPKTHAAVQRPYTERDALALQYNTARIRTMADIIARNPTRYVRYVRGWMNRATSHIDEIAQDVAAWSLDLFPEERA